MSKKETLTGVVLLVTVIVGMYTGLTYINEHTSLELETPAEYYILCSESTKNLIDRNICLKEFETVQRTYDCYKLFKFNDADNLLDSADLTEFRQVCVNEIDK